MDEATDNIVHDDSGNELHSTPTTATTANGKFTRSLYFNGGGGVTIPHNSIMNVGTGSFSFTGWVKINDYKSDHMTDFAVRQGYGCYFLPGRPGFTAGWEIGHGHYADVTNVCIRDHLKKVARKYIKHDKEFSSQRLVNKWTHYAVVFDRNTKRANLYINGVCQSDFMDIKTVSGSVNNDQPFTFGGMYGWRTKGNIEEYRFYRGALTQNDVKIIFQDHTV